jgi:hypothetical protein
MSKYEISVHGCDDSSVFIMELTNEEKSIVERVAQKCTETSTYKCMPTMEIKQLSDKEKIMGREVRKVVENWQHPKKENGEYKPLLRVNSYDSADGLQIEIEGCDVPDKNDYMPDWSEEEKTHYMMYENTSEGTPISPAFATPEDLAQWLSDNNASAFGNMTASYEAWLLMINKGSSPSMVFSPKAGIISGVEAEALLRKGYM